MSRFTKIIPLLLLLSLLSPAVDRFPVQGALPLHSETHSVEREHRQPAEASKLSTADSLPPVGEQVVIERVTYTLDDQSVAVHVTGHPDESQNGIFYIHTDHLGSRTVQTDRATGQAVVGSETRFYPFGSYRQAPTEPLTGRGYTGHQHNDDLGLIYMNARYYVPGIGRFASADTIVPDPTNPQSFNRYSYVYNNPVKNSDPSGNCIFAVADTIACIIVGSKIIDYGLTAWDSYQAGRVLSDPNAAHGDKLMAGMTVGLAVLFEAIEPDDLLPIGIPADDIARRKILNGAEEAIQQGGSEALDEFLRDQLGGHADDVLAKIDELLGFTDVRFHENPGQVQHIFREAHLLDDTLENRQLLLDTVSRHNFVKTDEHGVQWFARLLDDGTEVWISVRNGVVQNGGKNKVPRLTD